MRLRAGHINFNDEVSAAMRLADGVLLVVDAAEGVMLVTEKAIKQALGEGLPIALLLTKVGASPSGPAAVLLALWENCSQTTVTRGGWTFVPASPGVSQHSLLWCHSIVPVHSGGGDDYASQGAGTARVAAAGVAENCMVPLARSCSSGTRLRPAPVIACMRQSWPSKGYF